jgi:hypothetical protein
MVWSLRSDSLLEVELLMLEMNLLEDMGIGINMENGGEMLLHIHGLEMVVEKRLARRFGGVTRFSSLDELLYYMLQLRYDNYPCVDIRITCCKAMIWICRQNSD